jgi:cysteinyl-tRNA synthetase
VIRYAMLSTQYRQPINWSQQKLEDAAIALSNFKQFSLDDGGNTPPSRELLDALADDLNSPRAITELHRLLDASRNPIATEHGPHQQLFASCKILGLDLKKGEFDARSMSVRCVDEVAVRELVDARWAARKAKNFAEADRIRDELAAMGVVLKDSKDGTTWEIAR